MQREKKYSIKSCLVALCSSIFFIGCGASSTGKQEIEQMSINEVYSVSPGDIISPTSADTQIEVLHTLQDDTKTVVLLAGTAELIRGDYEMGE